MQQFSPHPNIIFCFRKYRADILAKVRVRNLRQVDIMAMLLNSHVQLQLEYMKLFMIEPLNQMVNTVAEVKFTLTPFHRLR